MARKKKNQQRVQSEVEVPDQAPVEQPPVDVPVPESVQKRELTVIDMIDITRIVPSPFNPRKFEEGDRGVGELARSIEAKGLIEPIHVRPLDDGKYEIIFGERRWRACTQIGKEKIECIIRAVSENEARELIAIEYFQHEDLTLLEEATGIQMYLDTGIEAAVVAENIGKPLGWVLKRAKLRDLSEKWKAVVNDKDNPFSSWSVSHLEVIVRFDHRVQDEIMEFFGKGYYDIETVSVNRLKDMVAKYLKKLSSAPWPLDAEVQGSTDGACAQCMKRSGAQAVLFDEVRIEPKDDSCLDTECFDRKLNAWLEAQARTLGEQHTDLVLVDDSTWSVRFLPEDSTIKRNAISPGNYLSANEGDEGAFPALIVDGPDIGRVRYFRLRPEPASDSGQPYDGRNRFDEHGNKLPTPLSVRRARLEKRRTVRYIETVMNFLDGSEPQNIEAMTATLDERKILVAILSFGAQRPGGFYRDDMTLWNNYHAALVGEYDREKTLKSLLLCVTPIWQKQLHEESKAVNPSPDLADQVCAFFDWPAETWKQDARVEIPEPAVWATLNEDGTPNALASLSTSAGAAEESLYPEMRDDVPEALSVGAIEDAEFSEITEDTVYDPEYAQEEGEFSDDFDELADIAA